MVALIAAGACRVAQAQIALPEIVVTSPTPILIRRSTPQPAPPRVDAPVRRSRSARPVAPSWPVASLQAALDPPRAETASLPVGLLPVVADTFAPVTVVPRTEIVREQPKTLGDALFDKPGISGTTYAPGAANRPIIRGLDHYRVRIQENGIGVHDVSPLGEDHAVPINPLVQDRIEVIRGPATLRYGSQAIGGVVSAENNRIPSFIPQGGYAAQVLSGNSSVDRGGVGAATVDAGDGNVAFHADGFKTRTDDYQTPAGRQPNSATRTQGGAVGYSVIGPNGFLGVSFSHYEARYQIPGGETATQRTQLDPAQDRVQIRGEYRFDGGPFDTVRLWLGGSSYRHNEHGLDDDGVFGVRATFKNREVEGRLELEHVPVPTNFGTLTGAVGFQADRTRLGTSGEAGGLLAPTDSRFVAGYLFEQLDVGNGFKVQAAGRSEYARAAGTPLLFPGGFLPTISPTGEVDANGDPILAPDDPASAARRRKFMPMSAAIGALQTLPYGFVASLNGHYVERAPAAPELYSRGAHDATATFEIGDPILKLERARTVEVGLRPRRRPVPARRHRLLHPLYRVHLQAADRHAVRRRIHDLRRRYRAAADRVLPAERHVLRCGDRGAGRRDPDPVGLHRHRCAIRLRGGRGSMTERTSPASRRTGSEAACSGARPAGSRRSTSCTPSTIARPRRSKPSRKATTTCGRR